MYDFRTLSPLDFEELVRDLLQAELKLRLESFGPGRDTGVDFRFAVGSQSAIVQAKHYADSGLSALLRALSHEDAKVARLRPVRYLLATSISLTPASKARVVRALPSAPLVEADILGKADLNNLLRRHPEIERRHFKLWLASTAVLERILHSGVYNRTQTELDVVRSAVPKFVHNEAVPRAQAILDKSNVLIISGEPGIGKSTLARMLIWLHAEQDWQISVIDDMREAFEVANEGEKRLIFFDDFLGQVRLSTDHIRSVDQRFSPFVQRVRMAANLRFVLTTRDYILHQAQAQSSRLSDVSIKSNELVLNVGHYNRSAKARILYNHIYFSKLSQSQRFELLEDDFFLTMIDHRNFNPRLIDLLTSADYVSVTAMPMREMVTSVLADPRVLWEKPYRSHISEEGKALMMAQFFNASRVDPEALERSFQRMAVAMDLPIRRDELPSRFRSALRELEGSVLSVQDRKVRFSNPGVRDFLERAIREDRFIAIAVSAVEEFDEIGQAWTSFCQDDLGAPNNNSCLHLWTEATSRLLRSVTGTAVQRLGFVIDLFDRFPADEIQAFVSQAVVALEEEGLDGTEVRESVEVLERLVMSILPTDLQLQAQRVVSDAIELMLQDYGPELELDELKNVTAALSNWSVDPEGRTETTRQVLRSYADAACGGLSDIRSIDELDDYERELFALLGLYGVSSWPLSSRVDDRREELLQEERRSEPTYRNQPAADWWQDASSETIRSMFSGLRGA